MKTSPFCRGLALFLCCQPVFWMSDVALAQTIQEGLVPPAGRSVFGGPAEGGQTTFPVPGPSAPADLERARDERAAIVPPAGAAVDQPIDPDQYVCGPGDVFELNSWGAQNFKFRVTVDLEGRAFVSRVGYFELGGKTLTEARRTIRDALARQFPRVSFDVALATPRTFLVQIVDAVAHPGSYTARAIDRVAAVLSRAGGFGPNASHRRIEIRRRGGAVINADLLLYTLTGDVKHNPYVLDGDVVRVPFEDLAATIEGAVNRPGRYELVGSRDLAELVELAGGVSPTATQLLPISLVRREQDDRSQQKLLDYVGGKLPAAPLEHEDVVRLPSYTELHQSVTVVGAVAGATPESSAAAKPGGRAAAGEGSAIRRMPFVAGDSVRTLLERAGGAGPLADLTGSYIVREGKPIPVDLYALVMLRDLKADVPIQLGDTLVVPFKRRNILIEGAVFAPGEYPYNPSFGIAQYLALAGGPNRFAQDVKNVRVVTPAGEMKAFSRDLMIEPGSSVVVPERNFSRSEVVTIFLGIASVLVSTASLYIVYHQAHP